MGLIIQSESTVFSSKQVMSIPLHHTKQPPRQYFSQTAEELYMNAHKGKGQRFLEIFLILVAVGLTALLYTMGGQQLIVLNLFYLPVILAAFFLGRYRAGILALFCIIAVSVVAASNLREFAGFGSPFVLGLSVIVWGAVLGMTAILVGTLSDERTEKLIELHEAHVGVVEVLTKYLQSANPSLKARSYRVAELSQKIARQMKLSSEDVDNIRVAALLNDMEHLEITAKVVQKAMGNLDSGQKSLGQYTFNGTDLVHSLGAVLTGALPLILSLNDSVEWDTLDTDESTASETPFGAKIIQTVRAYDNLVHKSDGQAGGISQKVIEELRLDPHGEFHPAVLHALEMVVLPNGLQRTTAQKSGDADRDANELSLPVGADV